MVCFVCVVAGRFGAMGWVCGRSWWLLGCAVAGWFCGNLGGCGGFCLCVCLVCVACVG